MLKKISWKVPFKHNNILWPQEEGPLLYPANFKIHITQWLPQGHRIILRKAWFEPRRSSRLPMPDSIKDPGFDGLCHQIFHLGICSSIKPIYPKSTANLDFVMLLTHRPSSNVSRTRCGIISILRIYSRNSQQCKWQFILAQMGQIHSRQSNPFFIPQICLIDLHSVHDRNAHPFKGTVSQEFCFNWDCGGLG